MLESPSEWTRVRHVQNRRNTEEAGTTLSIFPTRCKDFCDSPVPRVGAFMGTFELEALLSELEN